MRTALTEKIAKHWLLDGGGGDSLIETDAREQR
jgi:hypothetical protein